MTALTPLRITWLDCAICFGIALGLATLAGMMLVFSLLTEWSW